MSIKFTCEHCRKEVQAPDSAAGQRGKCPFCGQTSYVPRQVDEEEIPLAPLDEEEERQRQEEIERLRRQERPIIAETGDTGPGGNEPAGGDYQAEDLYQHVVNYCVDMAKSDLDRASKHARSLTRYGFTGLQAVDDFIEGRADVEVLQNMPDEVVNGFLKKLRKQVREAVGGR